MARTQNGVLGRVSLNLDGDRNVAAISRIPTEAALGAVDRLHFLPDNAAPSSTVSPVSLPAFGRGGATKGDVSRPVGEGEIQVFGCYCGCGSKEGMVHDSLGTSLDDVRIASSTIADEPTLVVDANGSVSGVIDVTGDVDIVTVDLVAGETYLFSLRGTGDTPLADSYLQLFRPDGGGGFTFVNADDDGGNGLFSMITYTATETGTFAMTVESFSNPGSDGTGGWTVDVRTQGADEAGGTFANAGTLAVGTQFGFLSRTNDVDMYEINLNAGSIYSFELAGGADYLTNWQTVPRGELDTLIVLYDSLGNVVASNDDVSFPGDISSAIGFYAETGGTYYLEVTKSFFASPANQRGGYVIETTEAPLSDLSPLDAINWFSADNIEADETGTVYVYFGDSDENFGELGDDGNPMVTIDWNDFEKGQVMLALEEYSKVLGIQYEVTEDVSEATFRLLKTESQQYGAYFYPQDPAFGTQQGIGVFNVLSGGWNLPGQASLEQGGFSFSTILHEFGHAHGVAHPHDNGGGSDVLLGVSSPFGSYGIFNLNMGVYTVMSYNDAWDLNPAGPSPFTLAGIANGWTGTLSPFDIGVLQQRYGVAPDNETGDNVYTLTDVQADAYYQAIYDTGGTDTIAYGGSGSATIDLVAATLDYSPTGGGVLSYVLTDADANGVLDGIWGGYTIANGVVIENATGGSGNDVLLGNAAANALSGGGGDDHLSGRGGADVLDGGSGVDTATYFDAASAVRVNLRTGKASGGAGGDTLISIENATGSDFNDNIVGNSSANQLDGGAGDDSIIAQEGKDLLSGGDGNDDLFGGIGQDTLSGGLGDDILDGGVGTDTVTYENAAGGVSVDLEGDIATGADGNDSVVNIQRAIGSAFADTLLGAAETNILDGGDGDDLLNGGAYFDSLTGGAGADTFQVTGNWGVDSVLDFSEADGDTIDLSAISDITDLNDLLSNHVRANEAGNVEIYVGDNVLELVGVNSLFGITFGSSASGIALTESSFVI